jgi:hypothetical protein
MSQPPDDATAARAALIDLLQSSPDIYVQLNAVRDWINANYPDFELYLEDVWNDHQEGETWFEYILRSRKTLNETGMLGYDVYKNHRDTKGVWHLDDYVRSVRLFDDPAVLLNFIRENLQN